MAAYIYGCPQQLGHQHSTAQHRTPGVGVDSPFWVDKSCGGGGGEQRSGLRSAAVLPRQSRGMSEGELPRAGSKGLLARQGSGSAT